MRLIIAIIDFIAWRIAHAITGNKACRSQGHNAGAGGPRCHLITLSPYHFSIGGPTEGSGCVTDDASEHGRSLSGRMPASPSGAIANRQPSTRHAARAIENRGAFIAATNYPLVVTGQGDFIHAYFW